MPVSLAPGGEKCGDSVKPLINGTEYRLHILVAPEGMRVNLT